jgi:hypothetical protein
VTLTLIFYPRKSVVTASLGSHDNNNSTTHNNNNNNYNNNNNNSGRHDIIINNKRGPSDRFRLARRNNEVQSEELINDIQNHSKAQLAENEVLDPYWARDDSRQEQDYQQQYQQQQVQQQQQQQQRHKQGHLRAFSHDSRNDTAITLTNLASPPPALTIVTSSAGVPNVAKNVMSPTSPPPRGSPTSPTAHNGNSGRPELETRTLYYHEALAKAQQQQQQQEANEYYNMTAPVDSEHNNKSSIPQRSFSQGSHYQINSGSSSGNNSNNNSNGNRNSGGASRPERSSHRPAPPAPSAHQVAAHGRSTPSVDMPQQHQYRAGSAAGRNTPTVDQYRPSTRNGAVSPPPPPHVDQRPLSPGGRNASSMDFRPPRDYPSVTQAAAHAHTHAQDSNSPHELQRMRSAGSSHRGSNNNNRPLNPATAHQEMEMMIMADPRLADPRTVSALGSHTHPYQCRRQDSSESDLSVIQIAYMGNMSQAATTTPAEGHHDHEFYNGLSSSALRPYSPR